MLLDITSFGFSGLRDWLLQRVTAIILGLYALFLMGFLLIHPQLTYHQWHALFQYTLMRITTVIALLGLMIHAWIGMWTVSTDYIKLSCIRLSLQILGILTLLACFIWGIMILWGA